MINLIVMTVLIIIIYLSLIIPKEPNLFLSVLATLILGYLAYFYFKTDNLNLFIENVLKFLTFYLISGVLFSLFKWILINKKRLRVFKNHKDKFIVKNGEIDSNNKQEFYSYLYQNQITYKHPPLVIRHNNVYKLNLVISINDYLDRIIIWSIYWPFFLLDILLQDLFVWFITSIVKSIGKIYEKISEFIMKNELKEL